MNECCCVQKSYARYVDHDRNEDDGEDPEYNESAWYGSGHASHRKIRQRMPAHDDGSVSPLGPYDSPYASPPGPYDSPSASDDDECNTSKANDSVSKPAPAALESDRFSAFSVI